MDCDICYESFDHLERKPLLLLRCAHTLCASCVSSLTDKKCPSCSGIIEDTQTNWSMLKVVVDSKFEEANAKCDQSKATTVYPDEIKGIKFFESNDFKNAFAHFKKLTEHPEYEAGHWFKSRAECQLNLNQDMSKFFDTIEGIEPKGSAYDYFNKGGNLYCKQQNNAAIVSIKKAIELNPKIILDDAIPLGQIALSYIRLGQLEESLNVLKWFDKAIKAEESFKDAKESLNRANESSNLSIDQNNNRS